MVRLGIFVRVGHVENAETESDFAAAPLWTVTHIEVELRDPRGAAGRASPVGDAVGVEGIGAIRRGEGIGGVKAKGVKRSAGFESEVGAHLQFFGKVERAKELEFMAFVIGEVAGAVIHEAGMVKQDGEPGVGLAVIGEDGALVVAPAVRMGVGALQHPLAVVEAFEENFGGGVLAFGVGVFELVGGERDGASALAVIHIDIKSDGLTGIAEHVVVVAASVELGGRDALGAGVDVEGFIDGHILDETADGAIDPAYSGGPIFVQGALIADDPLILVHGLEVAVDDLQRVFNGAIAEDGTTSDLGADGWGAVGVEAVEDIIFFPEVFATRESDVGIGRDGEVVAAVVGEQF